MNESSLAVLKLLPHLEALVAEQHVTRAAVRMGIGQPAMSAALARLRALLGDPVLVQAGHGSVATPRAVEAARRARQIQHLVDVLVHDQREFAVEASDRHFHLMMSEGPASLLTPPLMKMVRQSAPGIRLSITPGDVRLAIQHLSTGGIDLIAGSIKDEPQELRQAVLYTQTPVCICSARHRQVATGLSLEQFVEIPQVVWGTAPVPAPTLELQVDEELARHGLKRRVALRVPNILMSAAVVASTDLLAVLPYRAAEAARRVHPLVIHPLPIPVRSADVSMFWHERQHRDPGHIWLRGMLREAATVIGEEVVVFGAVDHPRG